MAQGQQASGVLTSPSTALTEYKEEELLFDKMGTELAKVMVEGETFNVHKQLLYDNSSLFAEFFREMGPNQLITLKGENPNSFKLFITYLYSEQVPGVPVNANVIAQATRLKDLCQLYTMGEKYTFTPKFLNKVIDRIQDGFAITRKVPEPPLIQNIYKHTKNKASKLREFCVACVLFYLRSKDYVDNGELEALLTNRDFAADFLKKVREVEGPNPDARFRIRDEQDGVKKENGADADLSGFPECYFHVHDLSDGGAMAIEHCHGNNQLEVAPYNNW